MGHPDGDDIWSYSNRVDAEIAARNAEYAAQQAAAAADRAKWQEIELNRAREGEARGRTYAQAAPSPVLSRLIFHGIFAVLLAFGVEFATAALQQLLIKASATAQATPPTALLSWILYTGRLFSGLATLALLANWISGLFGRGCLGGFVKAAAILFFLLFLSGLVTALLVTWLYATGKIV